MQGVYCPVDVHWGRLEASALGAYAACPAWKKRKRTHWRRHVPKWTTYWKHVPKLDVRKMTYQIRPTPPSKLHCNMELILANTELKTDNWTCLVFTTDLCWFSLAILHVISFWSFLSSCLVTSTSAHSVQYLILCTVNIPAHNHSTHKVSVNDSDRSAIYHNTVANL